MKTKLFVIVMTVALVTSLPVGIFVSRAIAVTPDGSAASSLLSNETILDKGIQQAGVVCAAGSGDMLSEYETGNRQFRRYEVGEKIVSFYQRMIDDAIVEGDYIVYQFDRNTEQLLDSRTHWRTDLPEHLPAPATLISKEQAESMVKGNVQFTKLYFISPESYTFPIKPTPENPCWIVRSADNSNIIITIIDAVTGEVLGYGVPPPYKGFSLSGPQYSNPCSGVWTAWYQNAEYWFNTMGYPTEAVEYPDESKVRSHIQSTKTAMFYELAHGGSTSFASGCIDGTYYELTLPDEIHDWIYTYPKMPFTFIGSCGGMCDVHPGTLSYEFRKGSMQNTVTVGYCGMAADDCDDCWTYSVAWQDALFDYMNQGYSVKDAFDQANADYPACLYCMRFVGDETFSVVPLVDRPKAPDLVIEDKYEEWVEEGMSYIVHFLIHNNGTANASTGHEAALIVDGVEIEHNEIAVDLAPYDTYVGVFSTTITQRLAMVSIK